MKIRILCIVAAIALAPWNGPAQTPPAPASDAMRAVQARLDRDGDFLAYIEIQVMLKALKEYAGSTMEMMGMASPGAPGGEMIDRALAATGLLNIQSLGLSVVRESDTVARTKGYASVPGGRQGLLQAFGGASRPFEVLRYLPEETEYVQIINISPAALVTAAKGIAGAVMGDATAASNMVDGALGMLGMQFGLNIPDILASLDDEVAVAAGYETLFSETPADELDPTLLRFAFFIRVKEPVLFDLIPTWLQAHLRYRVVKKDMGVVQGWLLTPPDPEALQRPALGYDGSYIIVANSEEYLRQLMFTRRGDRNLTTAPRFRAARAGFPEAGASLAYTSDRFARRGQDFSAVMSFQWPQTATPSTDILAAISDFWTAMRAPGVDTFTMVAMEQEGIALYARGPANLIQDLVRTVASIGALGDQAALMLPVLGFFTVREVSVAQHGDQTAQVNGDLRNLSMALKAYALDREGEYPPSPALPRSVAGDPPSEPPLMPAPAVLTSPVPYISALPRDPFDPLGGGYRYYRVNPNETDPWLSEAGFFIWSVGPDGVSAFHAVEDFSLENIRRRDDIVWTSAGAVE